VNFAFSDEQQAFRASIRRFVQERWPVSESRRLADDPRGFDAQVWRTMTGELGLAALLIPEAAGGQGFSMLELGIALEELGAELAGGPLFASACLGALALLAVADEGERKELLPELASGEAIVSLAYRNGVRAVDDRLAGDKSSCSTPRTRRSCSCARTTTRAPASTRWSAARAASRSSRSRRST
jgi:alkylation response protein AidB-like acyl-CoA dehydrogenase